MTMADPRDRIATLAAFASTVVPHRFDVIDALDDGTTIPTEALSEDHTIGIYAQVAPRKMREHIHGYRRIEIAELRPQTVVTPTASGVRHDIFLEYVPLRGVRFRAEDLQYLEEGWWATLHEVKYPAITVLALAHLIREAYDTAAIYLNTVLPMPLWIRSGPLEDESVDVQVAIQARADDRMRPTNIHTECPMEYARRWAAAARDYYDLASEGGESGLEGAR
jgi:hypothetical protein